MSSLGIPKNFRSFVIETGSMEPNVKTGSLAFVTPSKDYAIGDIITFNSKLNPKDPQKYNITHRISNIIIKDGDTLYETKGDANSGPDPLPVDKIDVLGKTTFSIPYIGYVIGFAKTKTGFTALVLFPTFLLIFNEIAVVAKEFQKDDLRKKRRSRNLGAWMDLAYPIQAQH